MNRITIIKCMLCGEPHPDHMKRYQCENDDCGMVVCRKFACDGRQWNRKGKLVHILREFDKARMRFTGKLTLCGELKPIADAQEDVMEEVANVEGKDDATGSA